MKMSTNLDNIDELSNNELRTKLLEYGLPNIPITDTSRKVLINKLRKAIETGKAEIRRETIHVAKYSSGDDDSEANEPQNNIGGKKKETITNRRQTTIGVSSTSSANGKNTTSAKTTTKQPTIKMARRSGRITPKSQIDSKDVGADNDEHSDNEIIIPIDTNNRRKSRSPSLGKSDTVTTSYKHVVQNADIFEVDDEDEENEKESAGTGAFSQPPVQQRQSQNTLPESYYRLKRYAEESPGKTIYHKVTPEKNYNQDKSNFDNASKPIDNDFRYGILSEKDQIYTANINEPKRYTYGGINDAYASSHSSTLFKNAEISSAAKTGGTVGAGISSNIGLNSKNISTSNISRRYTIKPTNYEVDKTKLTYSAHNENGGNDDDDDELEGYETPYLSEFTRRLTNLSAIPLAGSSNSNQPNIKGNQYYRTDFHRNNIYNNDKDSDVWDAFKMFIFAFFKQYQKTFFTIFVILILIFIYVFFLNN